MDELPYAQFKIVNIFHSIGPNASANGWRPKLRIRAEEMQLQPKEFLDA